MSIVGFLNCDDSIALGMIESAMRQNGLYNATTRIYYCNKMFNHPHKEFVMHDYQLYFKAINGNYSWSINTTTYDMRKPSSIDWLRMQLFFLVLNWKIAIGKLSEGWDMYGVNLFQFPSVHYQNNCFWAKNFSLDPKAYNVYASGVNHYLQLHPLSNYEDAVIEYPAPLSCRRIWERMDVSDQFNQKLIYLYSCKNFFDPHPTQIHQRPLILTDIDDERILNFHHLGNCSILYVGDSCSFDVETVSNPSKTLKADIIYTSINHIEKWRKFLYQNGNFLLKENLEII